MVDVNVTIFFTQVYVESSGRITCREIGFLYIKATHLFFTNNYDYGNHDNSSIWCEIEIKLNTSAINRPNRWTTLLPDKTRDC